MHHLLEFRLFNAERVSPFAETGPHAQPPSCPSWNCPHDEEGFPPRPEIEQLARLQGRIGGEPPIERFLFSGASESSRATEVRSLKVSRTRRASWSGSDSISVAGRWWQILD
jgi:hypothetical protein